MRFPAGATLIAGGLAVAVAAGALGLGGTLDASANTASAAAASKPGAARIIPITTPTAADRDVPVISALPDVASGPVTGGTTITLAGENLASVASATFGGQPATIVSATPEVVTIAAPAAAGYVEGAVAIDVFDASGAVVPVDVAPAVTLADLAATGTAAPALTFTYVPDERIVAQTNYVLSYWSSYNPDFIELSGNDRVNFTSQGLLARGWAMDAEWSYNAGATTSAWVSSTAFFDYLSGHPERATYLGADRSAVKVGDVAQFDWDYSGDLDHTTTVTRVEHTEAGTLVYVGGHTKDTDYWNVDEALANGGGTVQFWGIK